VNQFLQDALPFLFLFYVLGSLVLPGPGHWALVRPGAGVFRARRTPSFAGLSPLAEAPRVDDPPLFMAPQGFYFLRDASTARAVPEPDDLEFREWGRGRPRRERMQVLWGDRVVFKASSERGAERVLGTLRALAAEKPEARLTTWRRFLRQAADVEALRARRSEHRRAARLLGALAAVLFADTFVVIPVLLGMGEGADRLVLGALALLALTHVALVVFAYRALKRFGSPAAVSALQTMALFPPDAMHAPLTLSRDLYADALPLAAAAALLPPPAFEDLARRERHRREVALEAARGTDREAFLAVELEVLDDVAARAGADLARVKAAPALVDASAAAYCPLCFAEYRAGFASCSDCRAPLRPARAS
jgi:hypothetical protein